MLIFLQRTVHDGVDLIGFTYDLADQLRLNDTVVFHHFGFIARQKFCEIKTIQLSVRQLDWNSLLEFLEENYVILSINHRT